MPIQKKATIISLITSLIVLSLKIVAYNKTQSMALFSDALETVINVITALIAIFVIRFSLQPADEEHPYGHGKIEYFSAAFEGGLIFFAGITIIYEGVKSFFNYRELQDIEIGLVYTTLATLFNLGAGLYLIYVGKKNQSAALNANGIHMISDVKTTAGIFLGLVLFRFTHWTWIDPLLTIVVGLWLLQDSISLIKTNMGYLLDEVDLENVQMLADKINIVNDDRIIDIHNLKIIRSGQFHHIDAHLVVPEFFDIKAVHETMENFEKNVLQIYHFKGEFAFHTDPCYQKYCNVCPIENCSLRLKNFEKKTLFTSEHLIQGPQYGKQ